MQKMTLVAAAFAVALASPAVAQGFHGATIGFDYSNYSDSDIFGSTAYFGSAEADVFGDASVALDLSGYNFNNLDDNGSNATLHVVYDLYPGTALGAYLGRESVGDSDVDLLGVEGQMAFGPALVEGYLGTADFESQDAITLGAEALYVVTPQIGAVAGFDVINSDDDRVTSLELGGEYVLGSGPTFFATIGRLSTDDDDENFVSLGAQLDLGQGTTFGRRSVLEFLPLGGS